jgi:hypothetical protein
VGDGDAADEVSERSGPGGGLWLPRPQDLRPVPVYREGDDRASMLATIEAREHNV